MFGPAIEERGNRQKRLLYETLKKAKQAKLLALGAASANAVKSVGKSVFKTVATLGIKAIIFNFLYQVSWLRRLWSSCVFLLSNSAIFISTFLQKINQVLDFKTRLLNNLEHKNKEQNSQVGIGGDASTAGSSVSTSTESSVR